MCMQCVLARPFLPPPSLEGPGIRLIYTHTTHTGWCEGQISFQLILLPVCGLPSPTHSQCHS